jgi:hypothetical protein
MSIGGMDTLLVSDYHLTLFSSAVDMGTSLSAASTDIDSQARPVNIPGAGSEIAADCFDIGADEMAALLPGECGSGARITSPQEGKRIKGNKVPVRAEFASASCLALANQVQFEYRPSGAADWIVIPGDASHPNPDTRQPFLAYWDVEGLADGAYEVRAVATMDNVADPNQQRVSVVIDSNAPIRYTVNASLEPQVAAQALVSIETVFSVADAAGNAAVGLTLEPDALSADTELTATFRDAQAFGSVPGGIGAFVDLQLGNGQSQFANGKSATIEFEYSDFNNDGIVDGTSLPESALKLHWLDGTNWRPLADSTVDTGRKRVRATTTHFSTFGLVSGTLPVQVSRFTLE